MSPDALNIHLASLSLEWGSNWVAQIVGEPVQTGRTVYRSDRMALTAAAVDVLRTLPNCRRGDGPRKIHFYAPGVNLLSEPFGPPQERLLELALSKGMTVEAHKVSKRGNPVCGRLQRIAFGMETTPAKTATVYTDASCVGSGQRQAGGLAWVVFADGMRKPKAGVLAMSGHQSTEVLEAYALLEAVRRMSRTRHAVAYCDSLALVTAWRNGSIGNADLLPVLHSIRDAAWAKGTTLHLHHIPRRSTPEAIWVDEAARWVARQSISCL